MKYTIIYTIIITFFCIELVSAQEDPKYDNSSISNYQMLNNPSVQTPDVTAFQKVNLIPVSHYTGRANISIPIYEIKSGGMTVPITLSYNTSGVKVADIPSNVGSNWSLNAGGMITKIVKGIDDFTMPEDIEFSPRASEWKKSPAGWLASNFTNEINEDQENDPMPDIYYVSAPGLNTSFTYINGIKEIKNNGNTITVSLKEELVGGSSIDKYNYCRYMDNVNIKSLNGIEYVFDIPDFSRYNTGFLEHNILNSINEIKSNSLKISKMRDPNINKSITFNYISIDEWYKLDTFYHNEDDKGSYAYVLKSDKIDSIVFEEGIVKFEYNHTRLDNVYEKALTDIIIKNNDENTIKHFKLEYDYFQSSIESNTPQSKRLRLDRVYQVDKNGTALPGYELSYNTSTEMPPRTSWAHDYLGYNNASYLSSLSNPIPKLYFNNTTYKSNYSTKETVYGLKKPVIVPFSSGGFLINDGNYSLEANEQACKAYILKEIKYPTGAKTELDYEINRFVNFNSTKIGGGLRIASQKITDEYGSEVIEDYSYGQGYVNNLPSYAKVEFLADKVKTTFPIPNYAWAKDMYSYETFRLPQGNVELTNGSFVGYNYVSVTNRKNNQMNTSFYYTIADYPNLYSDKIVSEDNADSNFAEHDSDSWRAFGLGSLWAGRDLLRGKLKKKMIHKNNTIPVWEQDYFYELNSFETYSLEYRNYVQMNKYTNTCYDNYGIRRGCGYYDEQINFIIYKDVSTRVITKKFDYVEDVDLGDNYLKGYIDFPQDYDYLEAIGDNKYSLTIKKYEYDEELPLVVKEVEGVYDCDNHDYQNCDDTNIKYKSEKRYSYPSTSSVTSESKELLNNIHKKSYPLKIETFNQSTVVETVDYNYKEFENGIVDLESVNVLAGHPYKRNSRTPTTLVKINDKGKALEILNNDTGVPTAYIWGYNNEYLVAEVNNANYEDIEEILGATILSYIGNGIWPTSEVNEYLPITDDQLINALSDLYTELPNAQITLYTHKPLVGVTSITNVNEYTTYYEYDSFNRLTVVKDADKNILSENTYHFKE